MAAYVLFTGLTMADDYHFVGPFTTEMHAFSWAEKQHPDDWWFVVDLDSPDAQPPVVLPPLFAQAIPAHQAECHCILCWDETSFHLIGPFADKRAIYKYINDVSDSDDDPDSDDTTYSGPYNDLRWYLVRLDTPPATPKVLRAPPVELSPVEAMDQPSVKICERARFVNDLQERIAVAVGLTHPRLEH